MSYEIKPMKGAGTLSFGMKTDEVREAVGGAFESFKRTPTSSVPCDYFPDSGVFAYYKATGVLEAIEFALPATPLLDGARLVGMSFETAKSLLRSKDNNLEIEADGAIAHTIGVSLYAPNAKENPAAVCESVLVFEKGYYD